MLVLRKLQVPKVNNKNKRYYNRICGWPMKTIRVYGEANNWIDMEIEDNQSNDEAIILAMTTDLKQWNLEIEEE